MNQALQPASQGHQSVCQAPESPKGPSVDSSLACPQDSSWPTPTPTKALGPGTTHLRVSSQPVPATASSWLPNAAPGWLVPGLPTALTPVWLVPGTSHKPCSLQLQLQTTCQGGPGEACPWDSPQLTPTLATAPMLVWLLPWEFPQTTPASATISITLPRQSPKTALSLNLPQLQPQMAHDSGPDEACPRTFHSWYLL